MKGHIFFISWFAGAGKGTVIKWLLDAKIENLQLALSCKTRDYREWETENDYVKLTVEEFHKAIDAGEFLEYNFVHGQNYYGTRYKDVIDEGIEKGKFVLKEMDILILPKVLEERADLREHFTYIFLDIPEEKIKERMEKRGDDVTGRDFELRMESARKEKDLLYLADYVIDGTQTKEEVLDEVKNIILSKKYKWKFML